MLSSLVNTSATSLYISLFSIAFNPTAWNIVARNGDTLVISCPFTSSLTPSTRFFTVRIQEQEHHSALWRKLILWLLLSHYPHFFIWNTSGPLVGAVWPCQVVTLQPPNRYQQALKDQPRIPLLPEPYATMVPAIMFIIGQVFVVTSTYALGITGTFLGDYFGILMDHRVEGFPFNVLRDPMYVGSTLCFAATALW